MCRMARESSAAKRDEMPDTALRQRKLVVVCRKEKKVLRGAFFLYSRGY